MNKKHELSFAQRAVTEFRTAIEKRPTFWRALIHKIRGVYHGKLTYSANWDDWSRVPFWSELDYIGLGGYFPLVETVLPTVEALLEAWKPVRNHLKAFGLANNKPILFTEWGYLSVDGCGWRNWELEQGIESRNINEQAQANCVEAMLTTFQPFRSTKYISTNPLLCTSILPRCTVL